MKEFDEIKKRIIQTIYKDPCMWSFHIAVNSAFRKDGYDTYSVGIYDIPESFFCFYKEEFIKKLKQLFDTEDLWYQDDLIFGHSDLRTNCHFKVNISNQE